MCMRKSVICVGNLRSLVSELSQDLLWEISKLRRKAINLRGKVSRVSK